MSSDSHKIIPISTYLKVLALLIVLTIVTVAVAPSVTGVSFGVWNAFIAFGIASTKAIMVAAIFMHLKYDNKLYPAIILTSVFFVVLLFLFCILDWSSRMQVNSTL